MIDTIAMTIPEGSFRILNHNRFSPNTEHLFKPPFIKVTGKPFKAYNNPTKKDYDEYGYLPRLTLYKAIRKGGFITFLRVEFSAPKLVHGNNFDELEESDFGEVCWKLKDALFYMGIAIPDMKVLERTEISAVHYSKNIPLTDHSIPYTYLDEFRKTNVSRIFDTNQTDFRNEGHAIKYRSNDFEVVLYDKLKDLEQAKKSGKKAVEQDNYSQLGLFDQHNTKKPFEVIRLEVRLGSRNKIKQVLGKYGFSDRNLIFVDLFSSEIAQRVLIETINDIEESYPEILKLQTDDEADVVTKLQLQDPELGLSQVLKLVGAKVLLEKIGVREFRKLIERHGNAQWYRLNKSMKKLDLGDSVDVFSILRKAIQDFERMRLVDYEENL